MMVRVTSSRRSVARSGRGLTLALAVASILPAVAGCKKGHADAAAAVVKTVEGQVTVKVNEQGDGGPAKSEQALFEGNLVATGKDGKATIEFQGGNRVDLQPDTILVVRAAGGTTAQFGAVLLAGKAKASSSGQGVLLAIGTPFGLTEMGGTESSFEVSLASGISVDVGQIIVLGADGKRTAVDAGRSFTIDGLTADLTKDDGPLVLSPMEFVLLANPKQVQVRRKGETTWRAPKKREVINPGDAIRTRKASGTQVQFGEIGQIEVGEKAELTFQEAQSGPRAHRAKYAVGVGSVIVNLKQSDKVGAKHEIEVAGLTLSVEPGLKEAEVEIEAGENNKAQVTVRFGRVLLSDGTAIDAGSTVNIEAGKVSSEVRPLAYTQLDLRPKSSSVVYYQNDIPAIEFSWKAEEGAKGYQFEVSSDKNFAAPIFREKVGKASFVYDRFPAGRYYWRVKGGGEWERGTLTIQKRKENEKTYPPVSQIYNTGEKTVVYYQRALPAITFHWNATEGATKYQFKVFLDGEFDNALVDKSVDKTEISFPTGQFEEGKYYWHMVARNDAGKDLATSKMNSLQIAYDNAIVDLSIKIPKPGTKVTTKSVVTKGEVQLGATLSINGKKVALDGAGRFSEAVGLNKGGNQIVYRTMSSDGIERYYVRQVYRR
jgi:hypothetical protein